MTKLFYWPLEKVHINQGFGQNGGCIDNATNSVVILCDGKNPPPGYRSVYSTMDGHDGLDLRAAMWTPCYAAREGVVDFVETRPDRGIGVKIKHGPYEGKYYHTCYSHWAALNVELGDKVFTGQLIGYTGSTGLSQAPHLHFEIEECTEKGDILNLYNGYWGALDPLPLMFNESAMRVNTMRLLVEKLALAVEALIDRMRLM